MIQFGKQIKKPDNFILLGKYYFSTLDYRLIRLVGGVLIWLIIASGCQLFGKNTEDFNFDTWTTDSGLPQNTVLSVTQTRDGYLWFATFDGLVRFDGVRFTIFNKSNTPEIPSNRLTRVYEDRRGNLWIASDSGDIIRYTGGHFQNFSASRQVLPGAITRIDESPDGILTILCNKQMFSLTENGDVTPLSPANSSSVKDFLWGDSGTLWFQDEAGIHESKKGLEKIYPAASSLIAGFYEDAAGALWLGGDEAVFRLKDGLMTRYDERGAALVSDKIKIKLPEKAVIGDQDGNILIGGSSLSLFDPRTGRRHLIKTPDTSLRINTIVSDHEGNFWFGTNGDGLVRAARKFITTYSAADGMKNAEVYPIYEDRSGSIWVGADNLISISGGKITNYEASFTGSLKAPQSFYEDRAGRLWIGFTNGAGYLKDGKFTDLTARLGKFPINVINQDAAGNLWFGGDNGLFKISGENLVEIKFYQKNDELPDGVVDIYPEPNGRLRIATYKGLATLDGGKFTALTERDGLASNYIRTIHGEPDGTLWLGTYDGGLMRLKDDKITSYTIADGLFSNGVFRILDDGRGNFWMSSNQGIYRVAKSQLNDFADGKLSSLTSIAYGRQDGMLAVECNGGRQPAGFVGRGGKLWFPTQKGLVVIDPAVARFNSLPPPVVIENLKIDNRQIPLSDTLSIAPGQSIIEIEYAGLSLVKSDQIRFKYRIENLDADWIDAGTRRSAFYSYLPAGEYIFTVIAANSDGIWNENGTSLKIRVLPPFWRTWWFLSLGGILVVGFAYLIYWRRTSQLLRERAAQELVSRRLIESQEDERKRLAGELHDSLSQNLVIIRNKALISLRNREDTESAFEQFEEIAEAAGESLAEVGEIVQNLRPFQIDRLGFTNAVEGIVKKSNSRDLQLTARLDNIDGLLSAEKEINLYRIIQESINNIIKHSQADSAEVVINRTSENRIEIIISDNGRGFDWQAQRLSRPVQGSLGLAGIAERARILNGILSIDSSVGCGTIVRLTICI